MMNSVSVIVPTFNGAHKLPSILKALKEQSFKDFELVVVVDGSTDNTGEVLEKYKNEFQNCKVIYQENGGRAKVRNAGAMNSTGELLIFFDDDIRLPSDIIEKHYSFYREKQDTILVGPAKIDSNKVINDDFGKFRVDAEFNWLKKEDLNISEVTLSNYKFTTTNLSLSRNVFLELGGFDERLNDSEDFDLSMKAIIKGFKIYFNPQMIVWHDDLVSLESYIKRQIEYVKSKQLLAQLKPVYKTMHPDSFNYGVKKNSLFKKIVIRLFKFNGLWRAIITSALFLKAPSRIRFKIYDWIIYSTINLKINKL